MTTKKPTIKEAVMEILKNFWISAPVLNKWLDEQKSIVATQITNLFKERLEGLKGEEMKMNKMCLKCENRFERTNMQQKCWGCNESLSQYKKKIQFYNQAISEHNQKIDDLLKEL